MIDGVTVEMDIGHWTLDRGEVKQYCTVTVELLINKETDPFWRRSARSNVSPLAKP